MSMKIRINGVIGDADASGKNRDRSGAPILRNGAYHANTVGDVVAILAATPDEHDLFLELDSPGGSLYDGFSMYDELRASGRNIHANIVGGCSSAAVLVLLAASAPNRTANPNARSMIHLPRVDGEMYATAAELQQTAEDIRKDEAQMILIYAERTKLSEAQARQITSEERWRTPEDLLRMGFIAKINAYKSNQIKKIMSKNNKDGATLLDRVGGFLKNAAKLLSAPVNFDYADVDGNVLFTTASESDDLAVGTEVAFPDDQTGGTFDLPDGRVVTIENFIVTDITDITEAAPDEVAQLREENEALRAQLAESINLVTEMKAQVVSTYQPAPRNARPTTASRAQRQAAETTKSKEQIKNDLREARAAGFAQRGAVKK